MGGGVFNALQSAPQGIKAGRGGARWRSRRRAGLGEMTSFAQNQRQALVEAQVGAASYSLAHRGTISQLTGRDRIWTMNHVAHGLPIHAALGATAFFPFASESELGPRSS